MKVTTIGIPTIAPKVGTGAQDHPYQPADDEADDEKANGEPESAPGEIPLAPAAPGLGQYIDKVV